jgi:hypothetical protein
MLFAKIVCANAMVKIASNNFFILRFLLGCKNA